MVHNSVPLSSRTTSVFFARWPIEWALKGDCEKVPLRLSTSSMQPAINAIKFYRPSRHFRIHNNNMTCSAQFYLDTTIDGDVGNNRPSRGNFNETPVINFPMWQRGNETSTSIVVIRGRRFEHSANVVREYGNVRWTFIIQST